MCHISAIRHQKIMYVRDNREGGHHTHLKYAVVEIPMSICTYSGPISIKFIQQIIKNHIIGSRTEMLTHHSFHTLN